MANNWTTFLQTIGAFIYGRDQNEDYIVNTNYVVKTDDTGLVHFRKGVRSGNFVIDVELYDLGFADVEGIGWKNIYLIN